jgi:hypothetical protein
MNQFYVTQNLNFEIPVHLPQFSYIMVDFKENFDDFMAVKSDASGLAGISL